MIELNTTTPRRPDPTRALCSGKWQTFDPPNEGEARDVVTERWDRAVALCERCPVLEQCRTYVGELPSRHVQGVLAGKRHGVTSGKSARRMNARPC